MGFQVLPGQEQAVFQPHAARFKGDFHRPPAPPGPDGPQQLPGAGLHGKAHIGEVQSSLWDEANITAAEKAGITLL